MYTFKTVTDSVTDCDCCGRSELKRTMVLIDNESGDAKYFGTVCGARALGWSEKKATKKAKATWATVTSKKANQVRAAKFIASQPWGEFYASEFSELLAAGAITKEWDGTWRFDNRTTFTEMFKQEAKAEGFKIPENVYTYSDFCVDTLCG